MEAKVVVGSNWGDEAKGNCTNWLSTKNTTIIRFNGGAQAGHTVCMPDGRRHVFGHIGSGTFKGAATHLSRFFILNPILFKKEYEILNPHAMMSAHPSAIMTTHYDMIINQIVEEYRTNKHGSCGVGINETIERSNKFYPIIFSREIDLEERLGFIRHEYVRKRLSEFGIPEDFNSIILNKDYLDFMDKLFMESYWFMRGKVAIMEDDYIISSRNIIFEGAQGLLLDEKHEYFPHVTRSRTGLDNVIELIKNSDINFLDTYFCTRPYMTRHGNGPFPTECKLGFEVEDKTNFTNKWQGSLRFGTLDTEGLNTRIIKEAAKVPAGISTKINIFMSCCDQVPEQDLHHLENCLIIKPIKSYSPQGPQL